MEAREEVDVVEDTYLVITYLQPYVQMDGGPYAMIDNVCSKRTAQQFLSFDGGRRRFNPEHRYGEDRKLNGLHRCAMRLKTAESLTGIKYSNSDGSFEKIDEWTERVSRLLFPDDQSFWVLWDEGHLTNSIE